VFSIWLHTKPALFALDLSRGGSVTAIALSGGYRSAWLPFAQDTMCVW
jgi:hypothetical protein